MLLSLSFTGPSEHGFELLGLIIFFGGGAGFVAIVGSFSCALLVSLIPWRSVPIASALGALSAALAVRLVPWLSDYTTGAVVAGALMGLFVGIADEASRLPLTDPADESVPLRGADAVRIAPSEGR